MIRAQVVAEAQRWIGTPYHHQASRPGAGCDCLGLVRGVWRALYGEEPETPPPYPVRALSGDDLLLAVFRRQLTEIPKDQAEAGDVLVFAWRNASPARHCGIQSSDHHFIHAYWRHSVSETQLTPWWRRHCLAAFSFPERDSLWDS
ncbi:MAG: peptidase P60 [Rhodobacterales bacterium CG15_BIG_FIL_POST_REV_8_21_14_020_59_13]|nr:MAG: peptidase P60 [Rhodobacterales bacterium CG15_BIG_FIL_POST_REV_8_21_14_020_59_13]